MTEMKQTREAWLNSAVEALRPIFKDAGHDLPAEVRVSVGFPLANTKGENAAILAMTFATIVADDMVSQVYVTPFEDDSFRVLGYLVHELVHVVDDCVSGHKGRFVEIAEKVGCDVSKPTQALPGVVLQAVLMTIVEELGEYPHKKLSREMLVPTTAPVPATTVPTVGGGSVRTTSGPRKQGTRMLKVACKAQDCPCGGYTVRTTAKWLEIGAPYCPMGTQMERD